MLHLVIGAAFQGKRHYALRQLALTADGSQNPAGQSETLVCDGETADLMQSLDWPVIDHLHQMVRRLPTDETDCQTIMDSWLDNLQTRLNHNPSDRQFIIIDEIGGGVAPIDAGDRLWRERFGRLACRLAELAGRVDRIYCGLPQILKDENQSHDR